MVEGYSDFPNARRLLTAVGGRSMRQFDHVMIGCLAYAVIGFLVAGVVIVFVLVLGLATGA